MKTLNGLVIAWISLLLFSLATPSHAAPPAFNPDLDHDRDVDGRDLSRMAQDFPTDDPTADLIRFAIRFGRRTMSAGMRVGVNLAGADFGEHTLPGRYGIEYTYPTHGEVDYFMAKGMTVFRIPFRWERLQREAFANFHQQELALLDDIVNYITGQNASVILDPHNYSRYYGKVIGQGISREAFADFWKRLSLRYRHPNIIYGLMNEPHSMPTELWLQNANAAIAAIRDTGAANLIMVPGNAWSGAHSWHQNWYGTPNARVMLGVVDPFDNFAIEVHQYLDDNASGTSPTCLPVPIGSRRLSEFTDWLRTHHYKGFLGEFNFSCNPTCTRAVDDMLSHIDDNTDVWLGWTYWAAGPWWGDSWGSCEPRSDGSDACHMETLEKHIPQHSGDLFTIP